MSMSNKQEKLEEILKENSDVWRTNAEFFSWVRGGVRDGLWNRHPVKIKLLNKKRIKIPNPNPKGRVKTVWGATCDFCEKQYVIKDIQVDHIHGGNYTLKSIEDVQAFFENIVLVSESDLRLLCKYCNSCFSYAARQGISIEEAIIEKESISIIKNKLDKDFFTSRNKPIPKNLDLRRQAIVKILKEENA